MAHLKLTTLSSNDYESFRRLETADVFITFLNNIGVDNATFVEFISRVYLLLGNLAKKEQLLKLNAIHFDIALHFFERIIEYMADAAARGLTYTHIEIPTSTPYLKSLNTSNETTVLKSFKLPINGYPTQFHIIVFWAIRSFLLTEEQIQIFYDHVIDKVTLLFMRGSKYDQYFALKILSYFAFDTSIKDRILTNSELVKHIDSNYIKKVYSPTIDDEMDKFIIGILSFLSFIFIHFFY
jgi:hypothetical protein